MAASKTFSLKSGLEFVPLNERDFVDFGTYLYQRYFIWKQGKVLVHTNPEENGGHVISPAVHNGFIGTIFRAYNEHRHLILRPDDVWIAITTGFGKYINAEENAEKMRKHFVDFEGKMSLEVTEGESISTINWSNFINKMSDMIEKNTKGDARKWIEPDFTTTAPVCKTVGQVVLMGVMKKFFGYGMRSLCGIPKVTLEGTLEDWQKLKLKAKHLSSFDDYYLTHWAGLLDVVLGKFVDSYSGNVDEEFWSHIADQYRTWGSGASTYLTGWVKVFTPFSECGSYLLNNEKQWCTVDICSIPSSTVKVPVVVNDSGEKHDMILYGGHIVCLYNKKDNTVRPSLDWAIADITGKEEVHSILADKLEQSDTLPKPVKFSYGA